MIKSDFSVSISGTDVLVNKKIKLYAENLSGVRLFFSDKPVINCDVCIFPSSEVSFFYNSLDLSLPLAIAFGHVDEMSAALISGCSDYLCEPWTVEEMFLRIKRCLSAKTCVRLASNGSCLIVKGSVLYCQNTITEETLSFSLSPVENVVFQYFVNNRDVFFSRKQILEIIGKDEAFSRAPDMLISRIRQKIRKAAKSVEIEHFEDPIKTKKKYGWGISS